MTNPDSKIQKGTHDSARMLSTTYASKNLLTWFLSYVAALLPRARSQRRALRHVETLALGGKRSVFLIECDGQRYLVADGMSAPVALEHKITTAGEV